MQIKSILMAAIGAVCIASCCNTEKKTDAATIVADQPKKSKTVIVARLIVKEGKEADFLNIALPLVEATNQEEGNLFYELYQSPRDSKTFIFYEEYVDDAAFGVHGNSEHFKKFAAAVSELVAGDMKVDRF
jgi:quinol monooxygenase YgiN